MLNRVVFCGRNARRPSPDGSPCRPTRPSDAVAMELRSPRAAAPNRVPSADVRWVGVTADGMSAPGRQMVHFVSVDVPVQLVPSVEALKVLSIPAALTVLEEDWTAVVMSSATVIPFFAEPATLAVRRGLEARTARRGGSPPRRRQTAASSRCRSAANWCASGELDAEALRLDLHFLLRSPLWAAAPTVEGILFGGRAVKARRRTALLEPLGCAGWAALPDCLVLSPPECLAAPQGLGSAAADSTDLEVDRAHRSPSATYDAYATVRHSVT
eukprot:Selendium_serpulae@DN5209_c1_g3_i4.p1